MFVKGDDSWKIEELGRETNGKGISGKENIMHKKYGGVLMFLAILMSVTVLMAVVECGAVW